MYYARLECILIDLLRVIKPYMSTNLVKEHEDCACCVPFVGACVDCTVCVSKSNSTHTLIERK